MRRAARFLGRLIYRVFYLLIALLLLVSLLSLGAQALDPQRPLPGILGYSQLVVISGSMRPAIEPGDLLIIRRQESYRPGDIITFTEGGSLVTHRLLSLQGQTALTRGDANNTDDAPVELSRVQGKMVLRVPALGRLLLFLRTNQGMLSLTALLVLLVAVPLIIRGGHDDRSREKEEKDKPYEA